MKLISRVVLACFALSTAVAFGQAGPDASLWSGDPNPDGSQLVPVVEYEQDTGLMYLNTLGLNQISDTADRMTIGGDDVGMISISVESPEPTDFLLTGFIDGVVWNAQFFAEKAQMFGVGAGANYLAPAARTDVFQFAPGLTEADFGSVEMAVNYATGVPGGIIFGGVQIVPEPSTFALFGTALLGLLGFVRRR
ncbi:MAG: PEP-CTERM sorting domain-containing protein [Planctomycetota bacterium]